MDRLSYMEGWKDIWDAESSQSSLKWTGSPTYGAICCGTPHVVAVLTKMDRLSYQQTLIIMKQPIVAVLTKMDRLSYNQYGIKLFQSTFVAVLTKMDRLSYNCQWVAEIQCFGRSPH